MNICMIWMYHVKLVAYLKFKLVLPALSMVHYLLYLSVYYKYLKCLTQQLVYTAAQLI